MNRPLDLAEVAAWHLHRPGRDTCSARVCRGPAARAVTWLARADGLVLGRRIFLSPGAWRLAAAGSWRAVELLEHELVHVEQYRRLGVVGFLWRYLSDYLTGRWRGRGHWQAYREISLEREARAVTERRMAQAARPLGHTILPCSRGG